MGGLLGSLVQSSISSRTVIRVPFRQPLRFPCRYSASCARRKLWRAAVSAVGGSGQEPFDEARYLYTCILLRVYFVYLDAKQEHSLSGCMHACGFPFVVPSAVPVNAKNGAKATNEPCSQRWPSVNPQVGWTHPRHLERGRRVAAALASQTTTAVTPRFP